MEEFLKQLDNLGWAWVMSKYKGYCEIGIWKLEWSEEGFTRKVPTWGGDNFRDILEKAVAYCVQNS